MVGFLLDGRVRGPGARALAEDVARGLAGDGIQTHRIELVPTPARSPRILHAIPGPETWRQPLEPAAVPAPAAHLDMPPAESTLLLLADRVGEVAGRAGFGVLHAFGLRLAGRVAHRVHERTGLPFCATPQSEDLSPADDAEREALRRVLRAARSVVLFEESLRESLEAAFPARAGEAPLRWRILRRGVDLELFKPLPRQERRSAATDLAHRPLLAARLGGIDWERACVVVCLQGEGEHDGFERFLFALPELVRREPALVVLVVPFGSPHPAADGLRAALAAGSPELLHGVLQTSELYQTLLEHLEKLNVEGRTEAWWQAAMRLEPERRLRFCGDVSRTEFARLLVLADLVVLPAPGPHRGAHVMVEALAGGVLSLGHARAGAAQVSALVAEEISPEIASLCVLRDGAPAVREIEEKVGRVLRLRPEIGERLRALAVRKYDGRQTAADLRRVYGEAARPVVARA